MSRNEHSATLDVTGMTCDACEHHVGAALAAAGAQNASADHRTGAIEIPVAFGT